MRRLFQAVLIAVFWLMSVVPGAAAQDQRGLDVVIIADTSGPLLDQIDQLCQNFTRDVNALKQRGFDLQVTILAVAKPYACAQSAVNALPGSTVASDNDWGAALVDAAAQIVWRPNTVRMLIPFSNRGPALGDPVDDPGADRDAIARAIRAAQAKQIVVSPVLGPSDRTTQPEDRARLEKLAADLATATGGQLALLPIGAKDPSTDIFRLIGRAAEQAEAAPMLSIPGAVRTLTCRRDFTKCLTLDPSLLLTNLVIAAAFTLIAGFASGLLSDSLALRRTTPRQPDDVGIDMGRLERTRGKLRGAIGRTADRAGGAVRALSAPGTWQRGTPFVRRLLSAGLFIVIVGLSALFAAFADPVFQPGTPRSIAIYLSLFAAIGLIGLIYARAQVARARALGHEAGARMRPLSLLVIFVGAVVSRWLNYLPGLLIAIPAGYALTALKPPADNADKPVDDSKAREVAHRRIVSAGLLAVLLTGLLAWLLAIPLDLLIGSVLAQPESSVVAIGLNGLGVIESVLLTIYVIALLLVLFALTPLRPAAGHWLFRGSRLVWGLAFGLTAFIVLQTMINPRLAGLDAFDNPVVLVLGLLLALLSGAALTVWLSVNERQISQDMPLNKGIVFSVVVLLAGWFALGACGLLAVLSRRVDLSTVLLVAAIVVVAALIVGAALRLRAKA